jgi:hypothetical protein
MIMRGEKLEEMPKAQSEDDEKLLSEKKEKKKEVPEASAARKDIDGSQLDVLGGTT